MKIIEKIYMPKNKLPNGNLFAKEEIDQMILDLFSESNAKTKDTVEYKSIKILALKLLINKLSSNPYRKYGVGREMLFNGFLKNLIEAVNEDIDEISYLEEFKLSEDK